MVSIKAMEEEEIETDERKVRIQSVGLPHCLYCHREHEFGTECLYQGHTGTTPCTQKCGKWYKPTEQEPSQEWEKELEERFVRFAEHILYQDARGHEADPGVIRDSKDFIRRLLKEAEQRGYEKKERDAQKDFDEFWKELVYTNGKLDEVKVKNELHDFHFILEQVPIHKRTNKKVEKMKGNTCNKKTKEKCML